MKILRAVWLSCIAAIVLSLAAGSQVQGQDVTVLRARDSRDAATLRGFLNSDDPGILVQSAVAAGSLQDSSLIGSLSALLSNPEDSVRSAAAFALGQTGAVLDSFGRRHVASLLMDHLSRETPGPPLLALVEALGKTGDMPALAALLALRAKPVPDDVDAEIALSIGRMAYRGIKSREGTAYAVRLLDLAAGPGRWKPAYALKRIGDRELLDEYVSRLAAAAQDPDPDVRMECASAMGKLNDRRVALLTLMNLASGDPDWRVRVNALKALSGLDPSASPEGTMAVIQAVEDTNRHIALTALAVLPALHLSGTEQGRTVRSLLGTMLANRAGRVPAHEQKEAAVALARIFGADAYPDLRPLKEGGRAQRVALAAALADVPLDDARNDLQDLTRDPDPRLASTAIEGLTASVRRSPPAPAGKDPVRAAMIFALRSDDVTVLSAAAAGLADSVLADRKSVPDLLFTLQRLRLPAHAEAMAAIAEALGVLNDRIAVPSLVALAREPDRTVAQAAVKAIEAITGMPHGHLLLQHYPGRDSATVDRDLLAWVYAHREIDIRTSRGRFTVRLLPEEAPLTCMAFATLVRKGFYNGLTFHRVVPNFVVQGGDPRGDGWGGPGFTMRSEFGKVHYERGTVGIASSGKDTEGSQFFITHSRQPHLDGRYTVMGTVTAGMEVVDRLQIGDRIETIVFTAPAGAGRRE
jgi:cyclophilin family peptidyl-prolyl cis-trans isomerase/HEAT repeat protein